VHLSGSGMVGDDKNYSPEAIVELKSRWIVLNEFYMNQIYQLHKINPSKYERMVSFYKWVKANCKKEKQFDLKQSNTGPSIAVYHLSKSFADIESPIGKNRTNVNNPDITGARERIERFMPCTIPACMSLLSKLKAKTGVRDVKLLSLYDQGMPRLIIEMPVPGEKTQIRLSIIGTSAHEANCFHKTPRFCIQYYGKGEISGKQQVVSDKILEVLDGWNGSEDVWH
jgi:hypothetical protein